MVTVVAQPLLSTRICEEIYRFKLPHELPDLLLRIEAFYRWRELRNVFRDGTTLRFSRGRNGALNLSWDERAHEHEVIVTVSARVRPVVTCQYICSVGLFDLRIPEHKLQSEVEELEKFLIANATLP